MDVELVLLLEAVIESVGRKSWHFGRGGMPLLRDRIIICSAIWELEAGQERVVVRAWDRAFMRWLRRW